MASRLDYDSILFDTDLDAIYKVDIKGEILPMGKSSEEDGEKTHVMLV